MSTSDFLPPEDYAPPKSEKPYIRLKDGDKVKIRILSKPLIGWEQWDEKVKPPVPVRCLWVPESVDHNNGKPEQIGKDAPRYFHAYVVLDRSDDKIKIYEITQKTIYDDIIRYWKDSDWGNIREYDFEISRNKEGDRTKYSVTPKPKTPIDTKYFSEAEKVNLQALFTNDDPFENFNK